MQSTDGIRDSVNSQPRFGDFRPSSGALRCVRLPWGSLWIVWDDALGNHFRSGKRYEVGEQIFLLRFLKPGMNVLDIGAHHGLYSLLSSVKVAASGTVVAFEPSPREFQKLEWHLALNQCRNVTAEPLALGNEEATCDFFVCLGMETGCNSLRCPAVAEPVTRIRVPVRTLDHYCQQAEIKRIDFIKLDVEGAELEVLKGGSRIIQSAKPVILCELADVRTAQWGYASREIIEFLAKLGYLWFSVTHEGILTPCATKPKYHENLVAVHEEVLPSLEPHILRSTVAPRSARPSQTLNLQGDRSIEWSWIVSQMPSGPGHALDFGSGSSDLGLVAAEKGFDVTAIDLQQIYHPYVHPRFRFIQGDIFRVEFPQEHFDLVINCSTIEHVGLAGRYGVTEDLPDGDLEAMSRLRSFMKSGGVMLLTIPVGRDGLFIPLCRVYGGVRLPRLLTGFDVEKESYWVKDNLNRWVMCERKRALSFHASVGSWDPKQNVYALACFVLRRSA